MAFLLCKSLSFDLLLEQLFVALLRSWQKFRGRDSSVAEHRPYVIACLIMGAIGGIRVGNLAGNHHIPCKAGLHDILGKLRAGSVIADVLAGGKGPAWPNLPGRFTVRPPLPPISKLNIVFVL